MSTHDDLRRKREAREEGRDPYTEPPTTDESEPVLVEIRQRAEHVQGAYADKVEAIMNERQQARSILQRAIAYGMPAIEALVGKIEVHHEKVAELRPDLGLRTRQVSQRHFPLRGVLLVDRFPIQQGDRGATGAYSGTGLYLLESGDMAIGRRSGHWSIRLGDTSEFYLELDPVTLAEALQHFRVEQILEGLLAVLTTQGALAQQASHVRAKAQKLTAALSAMTEFLA